MLQPIDGWDPVALLCEPVNSLTRRSDDYHHIDDDWDRKDDVDVVTAVHHGHVATDAEDDNINVLKCCKM